MCWVTHILTCVHVCELISRIQLFATPWTAAHQAPLLMGFPKQEYWSGLLLQGLFLTQGSNPGLLYCGQILYCLSHQEIPTLLHTLSNLIKQSRFTIFSLQLRELRLLTGQLQGLYTFHYTICFLIWTGGSTPYALFACKDVGQGVGLLPSGVSGLLAAKNWSNPQRAPRSQSN